MVESKDCVTSGSLSPCCRMVNAHSVTSVLSRQAAQAVRVAQALRAAPAMLGIGIAALGCAPAHADSWANPVVREVFSPDRGHFVRVIPGASWGDTMGFAGAAKGPYATAEYYARQGDKSYRLTATATLVNPVAPVDYFVSNDGRLVTVDNWHNRGYGKVLAVYDAAGKLVQAYALTDLFARQEIDSAQRSVSSIAWHLGPVYLNQDQRTLYLMVASGRDLVVGVESGRYAFCETREGKYVCRNSNADRRWRPYAEAVPER